MITIRPGDNIYEVEKIISKRVRKGELEYLVKWEHFPLSQATWEPVSNLSNVKHIIEEYEKKRLKRRKWRKSHYSIYRDIKPYMINEDNQIIDYSSIAETIKLPNERDRDKEKRTKKHQVSDSDFLEELNRQTMFDVENYLNSQREIEDQKKSIIINKENEETVNHPGEYLNTFQNNSKMLILSIETVKEINGLFYAVVNYLLDGKQNSSLIKTEEFYHHNSEFLIKYYESKILFEKKKELS